MSTSAPNSYLDLNKKGSRATYLDLNRNFGSSSEPDILFDSNAISQALHNIFSTSPGEAGPIFNPEFGSLLPYLLQEPMDEVTAFKVRAATIQAVQRWEPRIFIDNQNTFVEADYQSLAYRVTLTYVIRKTGEKSTSNLVISLLPEEVYTEPFTTYDYSISYHLIGWPGLREFCILRGTSLVYSGASDWESLTTWEDFTLWGSGGGGASPFLRFTGLVDRVLTRPRRIAYDFHGDSPQTVAVEVSTSLDGVTYSTFVPLTTDPISSRFYKVRVAAASVSPALSFGNLMFFI